MEASTIVLICCLFFVIAFLYSSVGHGGASGYLAVLSLWAFNPAEMASTALILNIIVAGIAFIFYYHSGFFSARLTLPFIVMSIPFAYIGGLMHISNPVYILLLAISLIAAASRLIINIESVTNYSITYNKPKLSFSLPTGGVIGFISGSVGVGGGIFLSPIILLMKWANPKYTAATSACFIVVNSIAGISGRIISGNFSVGNLIPFLVTAILGGWAGSWWGAKKSSNLVLRRLLAVMLIIAAVKLIISTY